MLGSKYEALTQDDQGHRAPFRPTVLKNPWRYLVALISLISLGLNVYSFRKSSAFPCGRPPYAGKTPYAELSFDRPTTWFYDTPWHNGNRTKEDVAWNDSPGYNVREAIVALPDSFAESVNLPSAQRWPWDHSKGIYFIEGLHTLHCVKYVRKAILEAYDNEPLSIEIKHLKHCIEALRQFVTCHADDTPRYTGRLHDQAQAAEPFAGLGQTRMCKDWDKLVSWTTENSACYRWVPSDSQGFTESDRYRSCPDGKVYW